MLKLKKFILTILKYGILLSLKEGYLFFRNLLGLTQHPFKTFRAMFREQDWSQVLLVLSLPAYALIGGLGIIWLGRKLIQAPKGDWGILTKSGVSLVLAFSLLIFIYLGFWLWQVRKVNSKRRS